MRLDYRCVGLVVAVILFFTAPVIAQADDDDDDDLEWRGLVSGLPANGLVGMWVIGTMSFESTNGTEFDAEDGPLMLGVCVSVEYVPSNGRNLATDIESESAHECGGSGEDRADARDDTELEVYAVLNSLPSGLIGDWDVGGVTYRADANTEFEPDAGPFVVGGCVEVEFITLGSVNQVLELETEPGPKCQGQGG